ncbi:MAG: dTDP-4-amino-4,6-dideoxygalactose transaminase, partial [Flavobacteriales bacterium]|nr:dTDP-4-amino-4,6-dideoxygalactose transaminase [Flavobacteriales bacterium]
MIPFNAPYITGNEIKFIEDAINSGKLSGDGYFTKKCQSYFESNFGFKKTFLTSSCTDALEMSAMLLNANPMDEIILPSYTYVTSALAFLRQGLKIIFSDSLDDNPNIDPKKIEPLITEKTKAILVVHYAGVACDMEKIMTIAQKHNLIVIEDCAQAISSYYGEKPLGTFGQLSCFSFHETKNIISGEGGLLAVNDQKLISRAEKIWEKGTNRSQFLKGIINKYEWVDIGSSFLPSELTAAFLWAQLQSLHQIQEKRLENWNYY